MVLTLRRAAWPLAISASICERPEVNDLRPEFSQNAGVMA